MPLETARAFCFCVSKTPTVKGKQSTKRISAPSPCLCLPMDTAARGVWVCGLVIKEMSEEKESKHESLSPLILLAIQCAQPLVCSEVQHKVDPGGRGLTMGYGLGESPCSSPGVFHGCCEPRCVSFFCSLCSSCICEDGRTCLALRVPSP